jgi:dipeptidyl aminopeptidase/acylaminoacyl peptidase
VQSFKNLGRAARAVAFGLLLAGLAAGTAVARPFTAKDLATLDRVSDPQLSPDGRYLAYSVGVVDWTANRVGGAIWLADRKAPTQPPRMLEISVKPASQPRWSPDGARLYFLSNRGGSQQVWRTDPEGATAVQVTNLPLDVKSYRLSPDGKTLVVALSVFADCPNLACTKARQDARKANQVTAVTFEHLPLFIWDDWQAGERNQLFALRLDASGAAASEPVRLMAGFDADAPERPFGDDKDFAVSDREVIFSALEPGAAWGVVDLNGLYSAPLDGSAPPRRIGPLASGSYGKPTLSPDGAQLAFLARKGHGGEDVRAAIMVRDLRTGSEREADPGFDRSAGTLAWSADGKTIYAAMGDQGQVRLFAIDLAGGKARALTTGGEVSAVSVARDRLVVARDSLMGPPQLYDVGPRGERLLTAHNAARLADFAFSAPEQFSFKGWNDETVMGYVLPPQGYQPGRKYPVAFLIHGGPHGSFGDAWSTRWNPQVWTGMGYAVVMVDFHGSTGYGEAFAHSIVGHWGDRPLEDLQKGWAAALAKYPYLDGTRACALGGSYGGYMVAWMAGTWNEPWKCLVDHDGVMETRSMALTTDITRFSEYETDGLVWEKGEAFERFNPLNKVGAWKKPLLVIHGGKDFRVPLGQGLAAFTAAQRRGVPSKFVYYPDENHWVLKPQNSVEWYRNVEDWMRRWIGPDPAAATAP